MCFNVPKRKKLPWSHCSLQAAKINGIIKSKGNPSQPSTQQICHSFLKVDFFSICSVNILHTKGRPLGHKHCSIILRIKIAYTRPFMYILCTHSTAMATIYSNFDLHRRKCNFLPDPATNSLILNGIVWEFL